MTRRPPRLIALLPLVVLAVLAGVATGRSPAWAHTALRTSSPAGGERLTIAPAEVTMTFSEDIDRRHATVVVHGSNGASVTICCPVVDGATVRQAIDITSNGTYQVEYRLVARDGHAVTGSLGFTVDMPTTVHSLTASSVSRSSPVAPVGEGVSPSGPVSEQGVEATRRRLSYPVAAVMVALLVALGTRVLWRRRESGPELIADPEPSSDRRVPPSDLGTKPSGPVNG